MLILVRLDDPQVVVAVSAKGVVHVVEFERSVVPGSREWMTEPSRTTTTSSILSVPRTSTDDPGLAVDLDLLAHEMAVDLEIQDDLGRWNTA